jgi:hypothetical protein
MKITADGLNDVMGFSHVIRVHHDGTAVTEPRQSGMPEMVYQQLDSDGQCVDDTIQGLPADWSLMTGYTRQQGYNGPVMNSGDVIGGRMASDILSTPGVYVAVVVNGLPAYTGPECDDDLETPNIGWAVAYKQD